MARWILRTASRIMRFSVANGWVSSAPCRDLIGALAPATTKHHAAIIEPLAIGRLLLNIDAYFFALECKNLLSTAQSKAHPSVL